MNKITTLLVFLISVLALAVGGVILVLIAYGIGWLIHLITKFELFQSTILGLAGMFLFGILVERIFSAIATLGKPSYENEYDDDDDEYDDEDDDEFDDAYDFDDEEEEEPNPYPGIPRWRQPLKQVDFSNARPMDRCPCGSGKLYKNCHGVKKVS